jgi:hypothetical protein
VGRLETVERGHNAGKTRFGYEIGMRRYRSVRKPNRVVLGFLDEGAAHWRRAEFRFDFRASILFDA